MEQHLLAVPVVWQYELLAVGTRIVLRLTNVGRITFKGGTPCIAHILVNAVTMTIQLKESWHREVLPLGVVVVQCPEAFGSILMVLHELEAPHALHRKVATGCRLLSCLGQLFILKGKEVGMSRLTVLLVHFGISPFWRIVGCYCRRSQRQYHQR